MAILNIPDEHRRIEDAAAITDFLSQHGIDFERWTPATDGGPAIGPEASADAILAAYREKIDEQIGRAS